MAAMTARVNSGRRARYDLARLALKPVIVAVVGGGPVASGRHRAERSLSLFRGLGLWWRRASLARPISGGHAALPCGRLVGMRP